MANEITYTRIGDYYIPNLTVPQEKYDIGRYGVLHKDFLKEHHRGLYTAMLVNGTLLSYLERVNIRVKNEVERLIREFAKQQGVTESLKAQDQMKWVGLMNNIKAQAEEIVFRDIVYSIQTN